LNFTINYPTFSYAISRHQCPIRLLVTKVVGNSFKSFMKNVKSALKKEQSKIREILPRHCAKSKGFKQKIEIMSLKKGHLWRSFIAGSAFKTRIRTTWTKNPSRIYQNPKLMERLTKFSARFIISSMKPFFSHFDPSLFS
jgi:hypothetical protein